MIFQRIDGNTYGNNYLIVEISLKKKFDKCELWKQKRKKNSNRYCCCGGGGGGCGRKFFGFFLNKKKFQLNKSSIMKIL